MKVLGIVCSPRKGGNTEFLVQEALAGARDRGAETEHGGGSRYPRPALSHRRARLLFGV